ncbi:MAG: carbohydrate kinase [Verrucomicrobiota bacterium]|nr:carbohydrate kinase [Verrucomicrobiota bacterium]
MSYRIVAMGDGLWDLFPDGPRFGGATANYACHASILGGEVFMVSGVGKDDRGRALLKVYQKHEVNTELIQEVNDFPTGIVTVELREKGLPTFTIGENAAWDNWVWNEEIEQKVKSADALYFGTLGQRGQSARNGIRQALKIAKASQIPRILDVNLRAPFYDDALIRESVILCSVLKISDEELQRVAQACELNSSLSDNAVLVELRTKFQLDIVVVTRGAEGAVLVSEEGVFEQPGVPTTVVDTVGAGDSFTASMTLGLLAAKDSSEILGEACKVAAGVCSHAGAVPH